MAFADQLPHLLSLLDDESAVVQEEVGRALHSLGPELAEQLDRLCPPVEGAMRERIQSLVEPWARNTLISQWAAWRALPTFRERLEQGLSRIARYQTGTLYSESLSQLLDELAANSTANEPAEWARELFGHDRLRGNEQNYYHPRNSNLVHVLKVGTGNPISLTCIYILTSLRLGWEVDGCNNPGHFLATFHTDRGARYIDCYDGGRCLSGAQQQQIEARLQTGSGSKAPTASSIMSRVLRNLINGHRLLFQKAESELFYFLLKSGSLPSALEEDRPLFSPGDLVRHRRYGYRGVVVDYDLRCTADEAWYRSNRTQPDKQQPWYSVLVDGSDQMTYSAQSSLQTDDREDQVKHPLIPFFFSSFNQDTYWRNGRPLQPPEF